MIRKTGSKVNTLLLGKKKKKKKLEGGVENGATVRRKTRVKKFHVVVYKVREVSILVC